MDNSSNKKTNQQNKLWKLYIWPTTFSKMKQMAVNQTTFSKTTKDHVFLCIFFCSDVVAITTSSYKKIILEHSA